MKVISWNCQGMGNRVTIGFLRDLWNKNRPEIIFLCETKNEFPFMQKIQKHLGFKNLETVETIGSSGGLALFFNEEFNISVIFKNNRLIDIEATINGKRTFLTFVYGDPIPKDRDQVWERLTRIALNRSAPWFLIGDFNELTGNHEKGAGL